MSNRHLKRVGSGHKKNTPLFHNDSLRDRTGTFGRIETQVYAVTSKR